MSKGSIVKGLWVLLVRMGAQLLDCADRWSHAAPTTSVGVVQFPAPAKTTKVPWIGVVVPL